MSELLELLLSLEELVEPLEELFEILLLFKASVKFSAASTISLPIFVALFKASFVPFNALLLSFVAFVLVSTDVVLSSVTSVFVSVDLLFSSVIFCSSSNFSRNCQVFHIYSNFLIFQEIHHCK